MTSQMRGLAGSKANSYLHVQIFMQRAKCTTRQVQYSGYTMEKKAREILVKFEVCDRTWNEKGYLAVNSADPGHLQRAGDSVRHG